MHGRTSVLVVLPLPRHRESVAADLTASHRALGAPVLSIEGARTHAPAISTGTLAVFRAFQRSAAAADARYSSLRLQIIWLFARHTAISKSQLLRRVAGFRGAWLTGVSRAG